MLGGESIAMGGDDAAEGSVEGKLAAVVEREGVKNTKVHKRVVIRGAWFVQSNKRCNTMADCAMIEVSARVDIETESGVV